MFLNIRNIWEFVIFNIPFSSIHLWFLLALMYVYLIWLVILKYSLSDKVILLIGSVAILSNLVLGELLSALGVVFDNLYLRNFAFLGLPFFIFGYLIRKCNNLFTKIKTSHLILAITTGNCEAVLSRFLIGHNELYIASVFCCFSIILLAGKTNRVKLSDRQMAVFRSSTDIYVLHMLFSRPLYSLANILPSFMSAIIRFLMPCFTFALCVAFSLVKSKIIKNFNADKMQKNTH